MGALGNQHGGVAVPQVVEAGSVRQAGSDDRWLGVPLEPVGVPKRTSLRALPNEVAGASAGDLFSEFVDERVRDRHRPAFVRLGRHELQFAAGL